VAYEDFHAELDRFEAVLSEVTRRDPSLRFQLTVGSYGEVLQWINHGMIDVAILTPGVFAALLPDGMSPDATRYRYLATVQLPPATSKWASADRREETLHNFYQSVCLVPQGSTLETVDDLQAALKQDEAELLFVHPMSVSGHIAPVEALREAGITPDPHQIRYTYSHSQSLRLLQEPPSDRQRVAFVWDDAATNAPELEEGVRPLPFPRLEELTIPHDVVIARADFPYADRLQKQLLQRVSGSPIRMTRVEDWQAQYGKVRDWLERAGVDLTVPDGEPVSLDEIAQQLLHYTRSQPEPPRLALVLSGGGAKCSYQVGAVAAIEEKLEEMRNRYSEPGLDISLVVGTSGGAINSLPIALGVSKTKEGRQSFRETWRALDQRDIVRPSRLIRLNMGVWFALLQLPILVRIVRRLTPDPKRRAGRLAVVCLIAGSVEFFLAHPPGSPWSWLGENHLLHHAWLWLGFGLEAAAWSLLTAGLLLAVWALIQWKREQTIEVSPRLLRVLVVSGILLLPLLQVMTVFLIEDTLSRGTGMERAMAENIPALIDRHLRETGTGKLKLEDASKPAVRLQEVSRQIFERDLLQRDLVITGSCLEQTSQELPSDLYFFASSQRTGPAPSFGERGVSLPASPRILLDVIMGSGSIFPVFPARRISDFPARGDYIDLVDGGFAHNSPVEAAVLWGATHVILVEATPRRRFGRGTFLKNTVSTFRYLHQQAQLLDARSRGKVAVYSLAPQPPHLCVLDFADNLIEASIRQGYDDASGSPPNEERFRRELGEPIFREITTTD
jgi:predicted acylesterase/phospholipase RssA